MLATGWACRCVGSGSGDNDKGVHRGFDTFDYQSARRESDSFGHHSDSHSVRCRRSTPNASTLSQSQYSTPIDTGPVPDAVREVAWKAQTRLCRRYRQMMARGKPKPVIIIAIARELAGFVWSIACVTSDPSTTGAGIAATASLTCLDAITAGARRPRSGRGRDGQRTTKASATD